ncbi:MAG: TonB-dependent receptor [Prevotella sp.]|jgi:TonB-linked SusC/RagA family outer membrane protein|nr:TonB-dependent receptor [Prevotella sp.]
MKNLKQLIRQTIPAILMLFTCSTMLHAQNGITVKGSVTDNTAEPLIGASVVVKGQTSMGTVTDIDGNFQLKVPSEQSVLVVSYVGMTTKEIRVGKQRDFKVSLAEDTQLEEVVVVGYGQQKKASVVGAITQTTGEVLERAAGIGSVGAALTGNLPGVATIASTGRPGEEDPRIYIRGAAAWGGVDAQPLILVDGVKRDIQSVDITSVATVSVLKDASATAVYGVEGANGVILITTKRGQEGKARIDVGFNATLKAVSKLPRKYDSYDGYMLRNEAIEHELALGGSASWEFYRPQTFINLFRNQDYTVKPNFAADGTYLGDYSQAERYANIDWQDEMFKSTALSYNTNLNISGGTSFVKYFVAFDFQNEGDMTKIWDNHQGYEGGYTYNRLNVRSNLDFQITKTTQFKVNLAGSNAQKKSPRFYYGNDGMFFQQQKWAGAYGMAPNLFPVQFSDGAWGYYPLVSNIENSPQSVATSGYELQTITRIFTDFALEQKLDFITKGLVARGTISWDNNFTEGSRGISDQHTVKKAYILPEDGALIRENDIDNTTGFDFYESRDWRQEAGSVSSTSRATEMSLQLFWARQFGDHNISAMGNWKRRITQYGSDLENRREDWVFRTTYDYKSRYFAEFNGAYNGSQKFSPDNRFAFFCSGAIGWMVSEEKFMKKLKDKGIVDMFKIRGSLGEIGDDNAGERWAYLTRWEVTNNGNGYNLTVDGSASPFVGYKEAAVAVPDLRWATVLKKNIGFDYAFLHGMFAGSFDYFRDDRYDIFISGGERSVPSFYGAAKTPDINKGKMKNHGFEVELRFNKVLKNGMRFWANANYTYAHNEIIIKDDPKLIPSYRKKEGYSQGQYTSFIDNGFIRTYDELYSSPERQSNDGQVLIGDHYIIDFNGDGVVDETNDVAPYGYTGNPEHTYNATIGWEWKGFSMFAQLYGVTGVTRDVGLTSFNNKLLTVYDNGTWWNPAEGNGEVVVPRFTTQVAYNDGTQFLFDGSYFRVKNVELAYTWTKGWIKKLGFSSLKIYVNGNNLFLITKMPDDRESNYGYSGGGGAYPTVRRYNFGFKLNI